MRYLAIDFETANSSRTSICAFGYALFENGALIESGVDLCKPKPNHYDHWNSRIHGIKFEDTNNLVGFEQHIDKIDYYAPELLVAHNASFDISCLRQWCDLTQHKFPQYPYICTLIVAKLLHPEFPNHTLDAMCQRYQLELNHHDAGSDAIACGFLLQAAMRRTQSANLNSLCLSLNIEIGHLFEDGYTPCKGTCVRGTRNKI